MRSVTACEAEVGVCAMCYGRSLASGRMVDIGEAVGIIAAQSIGEPGTQLTMRTFHTGGVAGEDITHGLPRVVELFEARKPKGEAQITELSGTVAIEDDDEKHVRRITVTDDTGDMVEYPVSFRARLTVGNGDVVEVGQQLTEGSVNPHEKLRVEGVLALQQHLVDEVQQVYRSQGVTIHDKHIELIARQMLRKVHIIDPGETEYLPGDMVARRKFEEQNAEVVENGGVPASARPVLLGITKASLATDSWLSAASFQETTRVLTDAAISAKSDPLLGLKENVIIGKLIPAGSGLSRYRNVGVKIKPDAIPEYWLARQRELADAAAMDSGEPALVGLTREQAEQMLGGSLVGGLDGLGEVGSTDIGTHRAPGPSRRGKERPFAMTRGPFHPSGDVARPLRAGLADGEAQEFGVDGYGAGHDVAFHPGGAAVPVGDDAAGFLDQQAAGRDVPGAERQFEEAVEDAFGDPGEVQAGGAGAAEIFEAGQGGGHRDEVALEQASLAAEGEPGRHDRS